MTGWTRWGDRDDLRAGAAIVVVLAAVGAVLGPVWTWWSPAGPLGLVLAPNAVQADENEAFAAIDGRFAVLTGAVGLIAGLVVWFLRVARGPVAAAALGVGGLAGALATEGIGRLIDDGKGSGPVNSVIAHLPLAVHATALRLFEPLLALLVYSVCTAFAADDELGRPRPVTDQPGGAGAEPDVDADEVPQSVGGGADPQHGWGDGDAARALYEPEFPPQ